MENKKAKKTTVIIVILVTVVISAAFCFFCKPVYYRIYPFDRIKGNIHIRINKQPLSPENISFYNKNRCDDISVKTKDNKSYVSVKGGKYGGYSFAIDIPEINKPVEVCVFQANWWNTTDFSLNIDIDNINNEVGYYWYFKNNDNKSITTGECRNNLDDEKLSVSFGL